MAEKKAEKKSVEAPPIVVEQKLSHHDYVRKKLDPSYEPAKRETIEELKARISAIPSHKSVSPTYEKPPTAEDQPELYAEPTLDYE